jgi:SAM-dependent MidA family methyltransferase
MDYIQREEPELYTRTKYTIIEISSALADKQASQTSANALKKKHKAVQVINKSIFDWNQRISDPCFFIAMEVIVRATGFTENQLLIIDIFSNEK